MEGPSFSCEEEQEEDKGDEEVSGCDCDMPEPSLGILDCGGDEGACACRGAVGGRFRIDENKSSLLDLDVARFE